MTTETLRIKVVGLRELNKVNTAVDKLDKKMKAINKSRVTGTTNALKVLRQELSLKNKILKTDQQILKARNGQVKANKANVATQAPRPGGGGGGGGGGSGLSSALISGAFPLLFGQGPLAAAGGFAGGLIGDRVGGKMGGFAGGLVGTTIATGIQTAITSIGELGQAMNALNPDITALTKSMGAMGTIEERRLQIIEQTQGKQAALNAALEMMGDKIGEENVEELRKFGEAFRNLTNSTVLFFTKVQAAVAKLLNQAVDAGADADLRGRARKFVEENPNNRAFFDVNKKIENIQNRETTGRSEAKQKQDDLRAAKAEKLEIAETLILEKDKDKLRAKTNKLITAGLAELEKENELHRAIIAGKEEEFLIEQAVKSEVEKIGLTMETINKGQLKRIRDGIIINKDLKEQAENAKKVEEAFKNIAKSIQDDIKEGIKGLIKGTSTLADMLNKVADKFLDLAIDQAFGSVGGGGIFGFLGNIFKRERGGPVAGGNPYVVGEKGPELFVPRSSGTIVPNNQLGGGGSTSVVVNVDASGTSAEGDEPDAAQLGRLIGSVVQAELIKESRPGGLLSSTR